MNLNPVGVDNHGRTADIAHIKAGFALLDEVFHISPLAVKADKLIRLAGYSITVKLLEGIFFQIKMPEEVLDGRS